jgi:Methyltransferase domain
MSCEIEKGTGILGPPNMQRVKRIVKQLVFTWLNRHPAFMEQLLEEGLLRRYEMPVPLTHYYSPMPDLPVVKERLSRWYRDSTCEGLEWNLERQRVFVSELEVYKAECDNLSSFDDVTAQGYGSGYGEVEAHFLHCMIRHLKPRQIIEVGSGVSTYFALQAVQMNCQLDVSPASVVCIEPFPTPKLRELAQQRQVTLRSEEVQNVEIDLFRELGAGDILFIDSTHVNKIDSDVNWLYLDVLPRLRNGVVIHIHDIPFPYLTLAPEHSLFDLSLMWNESALVKAFLMYNRSFDVLMCQSYLHHKCPSAIKNVASIYDEKKHFPTSLWLSKNRQGIEPRAS